jgi:ATP-dependent protease Clp ATPase subunit
MKKEKVIGQESLVNEVSKIFDIFINSDCEIRPHFIITGESGSGKSFVIQQLTKEKKLGFLEINAAQLTKEGVSGNSLSKALSPMLQKSSTPTIVFVDEFDKLFISGNSNESAAHESTTGVQNEFLKVLESNTASVFGDYGKFINIPMNNTLFVFAGAWNGEAEITLDRLRELGLKTEFLGRVGLVYNTNRLSLDQLYEILDNSHLLEKYLGLFTDADREKVVYVLKDYIQKNYEMNTLGARMINTIINQYFIKGGKLNNTQIKNSTFQRKMKLK